MLPISLVAGDRTCLFDMLIRWMSTNVYQKSCCVHGLYIDELELQLDERIFSPYIDINMHIYVMTHCKYTSILTH